MDRELVTKLRQAGKEGFKRLRNDQRVAENVVKLLERGGELSNKGRKTILAALAVLESAYRGEEQVRTGRGGFSSIDQYNAGMTMLAIKRSMRNVKIEVDLEHFEIQVPQLINELRDMYKERRVDPEFAKYSVLYFRMRGGIAFEKEAWARKG